MAPSAPAWTPTLLQLWRRIEAHEFEPGHALGFTARLARDKGWPRGFARGAVEEYRRFCFLVVAEDGAMTPSEEVDEVWHLHLTYTRDYWDGWCGALGVRLHHDPTQGGPVEQRRFRLQYAQTLAAYERWFGAPPAAFWPGTAARFGRPRFRTVDARRWWMVPRLRLGFGT